MVPFVTGGLVAGEPVVVAVASDELAVLRERVGAEDGSVRWLYTRVWLPHPASRLRAVQHSGSGSEPDLRGEQSPSEHRNNREEDDCRSQPHAEGQQNRALNEVGDYSVKSPPDETRNEHSSGRGVP